jgi:hypothetical protein
VFTYDIINIDKGPGGIDIRMNENERNHLIEWINLIEGSCPPGIKTCSDEEIITKYHFALMKAEDEVLNE